MADETDDNLPQATELAVARPQTLAYRSAAARSTRAGRNLQSVREFMRPDHLKEFGKTLALVAPLTVLIWVWAEREQAVEVPDKRTFAVSVRSLNPNKTVALAPGQPDTVVVELKGPRASVEAVKEATRDPAKSRLIVDVGDIFEPGGPYPVVLDALIDQQKIFADYGVTVHATDPVKLMVVVDSQVERDVPVRLSAEFADGVQTATFEPKTVKVRGPERTIKQLEASGGLKAELDIVNYAELRGRAGAKVELTQVPLRPIAGAPGVTLEVPTVSKVTLQLSQEEQGELKSIVVWVNKPAGLEGHVTATVTPVVLTGLKVIGPSDALRQLREDRVVPAPQAVIAITRDDIGTRGGRRQPTVLNLPPGVRVVPTSVSEVTFDVLESTAVEDARPIP
jgi:hypothetical protein